MQLGEILIARGLVSASNMHAATERQRRGGGTLDDILVDMHLLTETQLSSVLASIASVTPSMPRDIAATGVGQGSLTNLMLRLMQFEARESVGDLAHTMCLPYQIVP
jgi:hypothetical protein